MCLYSLNFWIKVFELLTTFFLTSSLVDIASLFSVTSNLNDCYLLLNLLKMELLPVDFPHFISKLPKLILLRSSYILFFLFFCLYGQFT